LPQIEALKLSSLLPPKRSDPSKEYAAVFAKVGETVDDMKSQGGQSESTKGLGRVQEVSLVKGRADEVRQSREKDRAAPIQHEQRLT
jgi:hypothetical protein